MIMNGTHINFSGPAQQPINMRTSPSYTIYCIHPLYIIIVQVKVKVLLIIIFSSHLKWLRPKKVPGAISEMLFASSLISSRESLKRTWGTGWSWGWTKLTGWSWGWTIWTRWIMRTRRSGQRTPAEHKMARWQGFHSSLISSRIYNEDNEDDILTTWWHWQDDMMDCHCSSRE